MYYAHAYIHHSLSCSHIYPPSSYVDMIHTEFLVKICNEKGSSLQGLKYVGGPEHMCTENDDDPVVVPYVRFPQEEMPLPWECKDCLNLYDDIDALLEPMVRY